MLNGFAASVTGPKGPRTKEPRGFRPSALRDGNRIIQMIVFGPRNQFFRPWKLVSGAGEACQSLNSVNSFHGGLKGLGFRD